MWYFAMPLRAVPCLQEQVWLAGQCLVVVLHTSPLSDINIVCASLDLMIFRFKIGQFPFQTFNKFRLTANFYRFRCLLAIFHAKIILVLYDMGLFFNSTICGVTFVSIDYVDFQSHVLTGNSASNPKFRFGFW